MATQDHTHTASHAVTHCTGVLHVRWHDWVDSMGAQGHLERNLYAYRQGHGSDNVTSYFFDKLHVTYGTAYDVVFTVGCGFPHMLTRT